MSRSEQTRLDRQQSWRSGTGPTDMKGRPSGWTQGKGEQNIHRRPASTCTQGEEGQNIRRRLASSGRLPAMSRERGSPPEHLRQRPANRQEAGQHHRLQRK